MVNFGIRFKELSGNPSPHLYPFCFDLHHILLTVRNRIFVVVHRRRHSFYESAGIDFCYSEAGVFGSALGEYAINKLALIEFGFLEIATNELTILERGMIKENSSKYA